MVESDSKEAARSKAIAAIASAFAGVSRGDGVSLHEAGLASGLINTNQQIGGAIGVAAAITIATTFTNRYVDSHAGVSASSGAALTHGFQIAFYVLAATAALGALLAALMIESQPARAETELQVGEVAPEMESAA